MINENKIKTNSLKAWILAARPKTLTGAAVPVMIGTAFALRDAAFQINILPAVLCFLFAFIMQIDANFVNDYFDFVRGNDDETRLGPKRACAQGWITPHTMRIGIITTTVLACLIGLPLVLYGGKEMIIVGILCVVFCFLYTLRLSYIGMGDLLVLVFFGIIPVTLTYWLEMPYEQRTWQWDVFIASIACGLVIDTLLIINNYRDIDNDQRAGKRTLVVMIGHDTTETLYLILGITACLLGFIHVLSGSWSAALLPIGYLILHIMTWRKMKRISKGRQLNAVLGENARNMFIYGLLVTLGLILSHFIN